jgi:glycosyltransferase involved in cell wall biosynthesis
LGSRILFDSMPAWESLRSLYRRSLAQSPFLEYYWTWRSLIGGLYAVLLAELPPAKIYHTVSTGYAGAMAARAALETGAATLVTEHGIYTNERRIEITMADWIYDTPPGSLSVEDMPRGLKDMWKDTFKSYSLACYEACDRILTIFGGNQRFQRNDGADPAKMRVIPNGVDVARFSAIRRAQGNYPPTVALIGRVVPIKDVKTFVRACGLLQVRIPTLRALVMGPYDEDKEYADECRALVRQSGLENTVAFTGRVDITKYFPEIDVIALTSISEGQPLVLLEAGAAGIPSVATDVGACREIIEGHADEEPALGPGGIVTSVASPKATAEALFRLLGDAAFYTGCSRAIRERVRRYYDKTAMLAAYRAEYEEAAARTRRGDTAGAGIGSWRASASR